MSWNRKLSSVWSWQVHIHWALFSALVLSLSLFFSLSHQTPLLYCFLSLSSSSPRAKCFAWTHKYHIKTRSANVIVITTLWSLRSIENACAEYNKIDRIRKGQAFVSICCFSQLPIVRIASFICRIFVVVVFLLCVHSELKIEWCSLDDVVLPDEILTFNEFCYFSVPLRPSLFSPSSRYLHFDSPLSVILINVHLAWQSLNW